MGVIAKGIPRVATVNKVTPAGPCPWDTHYQFSIEILLSKKEISFLIFFEIQHDRFQSITVHHSWVTVSRPPNPSGLLCGVGFHSCQENKRRRVKIHPQRKKDPASGPRNKSDTRENYECEPERKPREIKNCNKPESGGLWRRFCRMGTSFLISFTLVSFKND